MTPTAELTLVPKTSLYHVEENLQALLDSEALVTNDQAAEFQMELREALATAAVKRDRVAMFLAHCESQSELAETEIERLRERKAFFERAADRLKGYVVTVIRSLSEPDEKGRYKKLEGNTVTLGVRRNPSSVEVTDEAAIPDAFKRVTVTMPVLLFDSIRQVLADADPFLHGDLVSISKTETISKTDLKKRLDAGPCPGATIKEGAYRLEVK